MSGQVGRAHGITGYTTYQCRCAACTKAWRDYGREYWRYRRDVGTKRLPAAPVIAHLDALYAAGHSCGSIAAATGVREQTIWDIRKRGRKWVRRDIADAIMGMTLSDHVHGDGNLVPADRTQRLVRVLLGRMTHKELQAALGGGTIPSHLMHQTRVRQITARRVEVLYRILARRGLVPGEEVA